MGLTQKLGTIPLAVFTDSSNNVGIGAAANASYKLQVTGTTNLTGALSGTSATFSSNVYIGGTALAAYSASILSVYNSSTGGAVLRLSNSTAGTTRDDGADIEYITGALNITTRETADEIRLNTRDTNRVIIASNGAATFSGDTTINGNITSGKADSDSVYLGSQIFLSGTYTGIRSGTDHSFNIDTYNSGSVKNAFKILQSGAATFSSSVTAQGIISGNGTPVNNGVRAGNANGSFFQTMNAAGTYVGFISDVFGATGTGTNYADMAIQANKNMYFYTNNSSTSSMIINSSGNVGIGTTSMSYAKFNVYNNETDITYTSKIQAVFGPADYQDSDATSLWGGGTSETQFIVGNTARPAMLSLGGNVNAGEGMGVINFFRSSNTDTYRSRVQIWTGINTTGTANQYGGFLAFSTAADGGTNPQERMRISSVGTIQQNVPDNSGLFHTIPTNSYTGYVYSYINNFGGSYYLGLERSIGSGLCNGAPAYATVLSTNNSTPISFGTNQTERMRIGSSSYPGVANITTASDANSKTFMNSISSSCGLMPVPSGTTLYLYSRDGGTNYRALLTSSTYFTGQHGNNPINMDLKTNIQDYVGMIVSSVGTYYSVNPITQEVTIGKDAITISEALPQIKLTDQDQDKAVWGVLTNVRNDNYNTDGTTEYDNDPNFGDRLGPTVVRVNSLGEGAIWVTNINGNIENGDYICSSVIAGYGRKQDDDLLHNYSVAKSTMNCDFDLNNDNLYICEEFEYNGQIYKKAFIGCTYHCG